jgi:hypothetical protein
VKARLTIRDGVRATDQGRLAEAQTIWHAGHEALVRAGRPLEAAAVLSFSATTFCWEGALDDALAALAEATAFSDRIHARFQEQNNRGAIAGIALARCEYERFETLLDEIAGDYFVCDLQRATRAELAGDMEQAVALLPAPERASGIAAFLTLTHGCRARVRMNAGDEDGARHELSAWIQALADVPPRNFLPYAWIDETLPALADEPVVRTSYERLAARPWVRFLSWPAHSIDRIRCALALRLGLLDKAETWYRAGRNWAERERCPVERGRCLQGVAEVAARRGQHAEARRLLDQAAALFQRHGALLYLRQVQEQSARLR